MEFDRDKAHGNFVHVNFGPKTNYCLFVRSRKMLLLGVYLSTQFAGNPPANCSDYGKFHYCIQRGRPRLAVGVNRLVP